LKVASVHGSSLQAAARSEAMAAMLPVRNTFLHFDTHQASDSDSESDHEAIELAVAYVRSVRRPRTTGGSALGKDRGELTPSTSGTDGEEEEVLSMEVHGEPLPDADEPPRRVERAGTLDAVEATPQPCVARCSTFDAFEGTPRTYAAFAGVFGAAMRVAAQLPPLPQESSPAPEAAQQSALPPQAVAMQGVAARAYAPQALMMAMARGVSPWCMPAACAGQQVQVMQPQQPQQQSPSGPSPAAATRGMEGSGPSAQQGGQQVLQRSGAAAPPAAPLTGGNAIACTYLASGGARVLWEVDGRRFAGHDNTVNSPAFALDLPGFGPQHFRVLVHAAPARGSRGAGFRGAKGRGRVELKMCGAHVPGSGRDSHVGEEYTVVLIKQEGARLGVDLRSEDGQPWWVRAVTGGLVEQWNATNPSCPVLPGDRIISANGVSGSAGKVQEECAKVGTLRLVLRRGRADAPRFQVSFGVGPGGSAIGREAPAMRGPVLHGFAGQSCCALARAEEAFDVQAAVDRASRKVAIHIEVLPLGHA